VAEMDWTSPSQCSNSTQNLRKRSLWTRPPRVRDREAPGSNPGPPTKNRIQIEVFACFLWRAGSQGGHRFSWN